MFKFFSSKKKQLPSPSPLSELDQAFLSSVKESQEEIDERRRRQEEAQRLREEEIRKEAEEAVNPKLFQKAMAHLGKKLAQNNSDEINYLIFSSQYLSLNSRQWDIFAEHFLKLCRERNIDARHNFNDGVIVVDTKSLIQYKKKCEEKLMGVKNETINQSAYR